MVVGDDGAEEAERSEDELHNKGLRGSLRGTNPVEDECERTRDDIWTDEERDDGVRWNEDDEHWEHSLGNQKQGQWLQTKHKAPK